MPTTKATILVVEDEPLLLQAIIKKLEVSGIGSVACSSGKQGLDYLASLQELPDAIWLDYYLQDMIGLEFMQKVKENSAWAKIPVFVVSNSASEQKIEAMLKLGAKKYLLKAEHRLDDIIDVILETIREKGKTINN